MVVDYSKWDKLELSDDSDIEVHPNVDKKSFIRWKQRDIHEKREQAKFRMKQLEVNIETNQDLLKRIKKLIEAGESGRKLGLDIVGDVELTQRGETKEKPEQATSPEQPKYTDMIESMLMQIVQEGGDTQTIVNKIKEHQEMIEGAIRDESNELEKLAEERKQHITADDIKTGWDSTIVYKPMKSTSAAASSSGASSSGTKSTTTSIETLNSPASRPKPKVGEDGLEELLPETEGFGKIPKGDMEASFKYLMQHPYIVTEGQKDALTMSAFEHELGGDAKYAEQVVWNSLLIQYSVALGKDGVRVFFSRIVKRDHPARQAFEQDAQTTYNHIRNRCKILREEKALEPDNAEELVQLHPVDDDTEILIRVPSPESEGRHIYDQLSEPLKQAIQTQDLAEINKYLAAISVEEAEDVVAQLNESGVLQVENKIYEPEEWEKKKAELGVQRQEEPASTIDEVD